MVFMNLINHIEYLLMTHECVVIPGIGAILSHGVSAIYDYQVRAWLPPAKVFTFNPALTRGDGLIAASISRKDGVTFNRAAAIVKAAAEEMRDSLEKNRVLELGSVGILKKSEDGKLIFLAGNEPWLSPSTCWLPILSLENIAEEPTSVGQRIAAEARRRHRAAIARNIANIAACILVVFAIGWILAGNISSLPQLQTASIVTGERSLHDIDSFSGIIDDTPPAVILSSAPFEDENGLENEAALKSRYLLIVASFANQRDAETFIASYPEMPLGYIEADNRFRIYVAWGDTWDSVAARAYDEDVYQTFSESWVFKR